MANDCFNNNNKISFSPCLESWAGLKCCSVISLGAREGRVTSQDVNRVWMNKQRQFSLSPHTLVIKFTTPVHSSHHNSRSTFDSRHNWIFTSSFCRKDMAYHPARVSGDQEKCAQLSVADAVISFWPMDLAVICRRYETCQFERKATHRDIQERKLACYEYATCWAIATPCFSFLPFLYYTLPREKQTH